MQTPIVDFVKKYAAGEISRFHMPGHKGREALGCEAYDITEVAGADALYEADGIIAESEKNATELFGTAGTFYATEGSSQCIRAMLYLAVTYWQETRRQELSQQEACRQAVARQETCRQQEARPYVIAARNAHKAFLYAAALVDFDVVWLYPEEMHSLCSCRITPQQLETELEKYPTAPAAVYLTCPDYLGGQMEISAMAEVCHRYGTILAVDNAHGAYLHFLKPSQHPMDLGADICCDSAHKTLPVLTGGAYLQIGKQAPEFLKRHAKQTLSLFGSTSPSYLILASLDQCNAYLAEDYRKELTETVHKIQQIRQTLHRAGWEIEQTDPLKLTIRAGQKESGTKLADRLRIQGVECEYADADYLVFMITPQNSEEDLNRLVQALGQNETGTPPSTRLEPVRSTQVCSIRKAVFAPHESVPIKNAMGRICGTPTVGCPPAIPIVVSGELIQEEAVRLLEQYGFETIEVLT